MGTPVPWSVDSVAFWLAVRLPGSWVFWWWAGYVVLALANVLFYLALYRLVREVVLFLRWRRNRRGVR